MKVKELLGTLNQIAPFFLQEESDNSGVQFADLDEVISKLLLCLDVTEEVLQEAIRNNCNAVLSHHPLFYQSFKRITRQENPLAYQLFYHHIHLIAFHTNFDLAENGLNDYVGTLLGLQKTAPLKPSREKIFKLAIYVPEQFQESLQEALFRSGAGQVGNYSETSFSLSGKGSFKPLEGTKPFIGQKGTREMVNEMKIETVFQERNLSEIIASIHRNHPYEEPVFDIYPLEIHSTAGIGMLAKLNKPETLDHFLQKVKEQLQAPYVRMIQANQKKIQNIALCTGSGGSLIDQCIEKQVDLFITGDIDYHEALRAKEMGLNMIDIEHFFTEKYFVPAIQKQLVCHHFPEKLLVPSQKMISPFRIL